MNCWRVIHSSFTYGTMLVWILRQREGTKEVLHKTGFNHCNHTFVSRSHIVFGKMFEKQLDVKAMDYSYAQTMEWLFKVDIIQTVVHILFYTKHHTTMTPSETPSKKKKTVTFPMVAFTFEEKHSTKQGKCFSSKRKKKPCYVNSPFFSQVHIVLCTHIQNDVQ